MTLIKICGITNECDAYKTAKAGVDFLGFNFYRHSKRYIFPQLPPDRATAAGNLRYLHAYGRLHNVFDELAAFPHVKKVGIFVNAAAYEIREILTEFPGIDIIQLSGDEPDTIIDELDGLRVWKTVRDLARMPNMQTLARYDGVLFDACVTDEFGGTGKVADWTALAAIRENFPTKFILAGGLTPDNIGVAIGQLHPDIVDTASGVEVEGNPRQKDPTKIHAFIAAVQYAT